MKRVALLLFLPFLLSQCASSAQSLSEKKLLDQMKNSPSDDVKIEAKLELTQRYAFASDEELIEAIRKMKNRDAKPFQDEALSNRLGKMSNENLRKVWKYLFGPIRGKVERELQRRERQPERISQNIDQLITTKN